MADHTVVGHQIVTGVQFPWPRIPEIVRSHHERGDGSGYPDGLVMEDVAMPVRIVGLADTFDAMTSERPYREPLSVGGTLSEIVRIDSAEIRSQCSSGTAFANPPRRCWQQPRSLFRGSLWPSTLPPATSISWPLRCNTKSLTAALSDLTAQSPNTEDLARL